MSDAVKKCNTQYSIHVLGGLTGNVIYMPQNFGG